VCAAVTAVATFFLVAFAALVGVVALVVVFFTVVAGFFTVVAGSTTGQDSPGRTTAVFAQVGAAAGTEEDTVGCATTLATLTEGGSVAVDATGSDVGAGP
jgi:hypothetical protein